MADTYNLWFLVERDTNPTKITVSSTLLISDLKQVIFDTFFQPNFRASRLILKKVTVCTHYITIMSYM